LKIDTIDLVESQSLVIGGDMGIPKLENHYQKSVAKLEGRDIHSGAVAAREVHAGFILLAWNIDGLEIVYEQLSVDRTTDSSSALPLRRQLSSELCGMWLGEGRIRLWRLMGLHVSFYGGLCYKPLRMVLESFTRMLP